MINFFFRMIGTFFAVSGGTLNTKEKIFMAFAWLPKATVQAALGQFNFINAKVAFCAAYIEKNPFHVKSKH